MSLRAVSSAILIMTCLTAALPAGAQTVYQWKDKSGATHYSDQPPPQDIKDLREKRLGSANFIESRSATFNVRKAKLESPVTLYSSRDCDKECKAAREYLSKRGVPFAETNVDSVEGAAAFSQAFGDNQAMVPSVTVGAKKQKGFNEATWARLVDEAGYPKPAAAARTETAAAPPSAESPPAAAPAPSPTPAPAPAGR